VKKLYELIPDDESFERMADKVQAIVSHRKPANDNALSPAWQETLNGLGMPANGAYEPTVFHWEDPSTIPLRDWIYGKTLLRGIVSMTIASGAVGKTSLKIVEALALATGRPLLGQEVPKRSRVWLFNLEDDMIELRRRVTAAMIHYNIKPEDIGDRLLIDGEKSLVIARTDNKLGTRINAPVVGALVKAIQVREIDVLIVDPFVSSHDASENDNGAMDKVMKQGWIPVAREGGCSVNLCHHTTKVDAGTATAMSGRGGGAVVNAGRSAQVLNPMSSDEAKAAGLDSPAGYFSASNDKENLTPQTRLRDWYKMESVSLGNGGSGNLSVVRSDSIGVVTRWDWPTNASFTEDVSGEQLQAIKNLLMLGSHRKDAQAKDWAGYVVGGVLGLGSSRDTMKAHDRQRIARMLDIWVKGGELEVYTATIDRQKRQFLRTA
jgi:AAA domain-containing protein